MTRTAIMTQTAIKPALGLTLCLYGALALGAYQLMAHSPSKVQNLSLGSATIDLDLGKFVAEPQAEPAPELPAKPEPRVEPEPQVDPPVENQVEPQVEPEPQVIPQAQARPIPKQVHKKPKPIRKAQHQREARPQDVTRRHEARPNPQAHRAAPAPSGAAQRVLILGKDQHPILLRIKKAIDQNLLYPRKARLMRHEGIAVVQFTYTKERKIRGLRLLKGTGHQILDEAALSSIRRAVHNFPQVEHNFTLRLPIRFELT